MKKTHILLYFLLSVFIYSCCCKSSSVSFQSLESAEITLPQHIQKILVINRYRPTKENRLGNIIEGFLTGEKPMQDKSGAEYALRGLQNKLTQSPRFSIIQATEELTGTGTGWFPEPLSSNVILDLCKKYQADGVVCLESFDSDKSQQITSQVKQRNTNGEMRNYTLYTAKRTINITVGWRLYDGVDARLIDEFRLNRQNTWTKDDEIQANAANGLPNELSCIQNLALQTGTQYADRIAPNWVTISRKVYIQGDEGLKRAYRLMQTQKYDEAINIYKTLLNVPKTKIAKKACYNIAVAFECKNDMNAALEWANKAYSQYNFKDGLNYAHVIQARIDDQKRVEDQMKK